MRFTGIPVLVAGLLLIGMAGIAPAQTNRSAKPTEKTGDGEPNIELKATEITESLNNIIGTYKLQEMEIVGSQEKPSFNYILRWKDPVPFPEQGGEISRNLINPQYAPLDSEGYHEMIDMTTEK